MRPATRRSSAIALAALCGIAPTTAWAAGRPSTPDTPTTATSSTTTTLGTTSKTTPTTVHPHPPTTVGSPRSTPTTTRSRSTTTTTSTSTSTSLPKPPASTAADRSLATFGTAKDITARTPEDQAVTVTVNSNITLIATTKPSHGTDQRTGTRGITYTPNTGFVGVDTFTYSGTEQSGQVIVPVTGTVTVTVVEVPPTARNTTVDTTIGKAVGVDLTALTTVTRGNTATYTVSNPLHGTVTTTSAGSATFTPAAGFTGDATFTYTVTDNHRGSASATVTVHVTATQVTTTTTTATPPTTTKSVTPVAPTAETTVVAAPPTTAASPALAFTGTNEAAVGLVGATLVAGGGVLTVLARRRRRRHPTWRHLRRS